MAAVFPGGITVGGEGLTAVGTGEAVVGFAVNHLRVAVPPRGATFVRAELHMFFAWGMYENLPTFKAETRINCNPVIVGFFASEFHLSAIGNHSIFL